MWIVDNLLKGKSVFSSKPTQPTPNGEKSIGGDNESCEKDDRSLGSNNHGRNDFARSIFLDWVYCSHQRHDIAESAMDEATCPILPCRSAISAC